MADHTILAPAELQSIADYIEAQLELDTPQDTMHLCGPALARDIASNPDYVLQTAHKKINTKPYANVQPCWLRLYEDASLSKAVQLMRAASTDLSLIVSVLDHGIAQSGAPGRRHVFESVFERLRELAADDYSIYPASSAPSTPATRRCKFPIVKTTAVPNFETFQEHLDTQNTPIIIPRAIDSWPALEKWTSPAYLLKQTLGGRRLVPVEIGRSYTDEGWHQQVMSFRDFLDTHLLKSGTETEIGYLAQHDLLSQIPAFRADISVPDYCYTCPPAPEKRFRPSSHESTPQLDEPLLNVWLGPAGTRTPLHCDPYDNILAQVVGYKYIRLYPPSATPCLYPCGVDEHGANLDNTSQVDVGLVRDAELGDRVDIDAVRDQKLRFPLSEHAQYEEGVLGPGECLYVPAGWWHYVESVTLSFSVSFWWN